MLSPFHSMTPLSLILLLLLLCAVFAQPLTISTLLGNGTGSSRGSLGPPSLATVNVPAGLAWDSIRSTLFFADYGGNLVRCVEGGTVRVVAGTGSSFDSGDGGFASSAGIRSPIGLTLSNGTLFVVEYDGCAIRAINMTSQTIVKFIGNGVCVSDGDGGPASRARRD